MAKESEKKQINPIEEEMEFDQFQEKKEPKEYKFVEIEAEDESNEIEKEDIVKEIRKYLENKKLIIGKESVMKNLRASLLKKIYLSSNCPAEWKKDIIYYSKINNTEIINLKFNNEEIGIVCKKPFVVSMLGVIKS